MRYRCCTLTLLADMAPAVLAPEHRSGFADEAVVVAAIGAAAVIAVIVGVAVISERGACDRASGADGAADHTGGYFTRPEPVVTMVNPCGVLLLTDDLCPRCRILRQRRRGDHRGKDCGRG